MLTVACFLALGESGVCFSSTTILVGESIVRLDILVNKVFYIWLIKQLVFSSGELIRYLICYDNTLTERVNSLKIELFCEMP